MKKSEKTKQLIISKAAALFNQKGYSGTSMQDIMAATGLTKGGIYGNFKKGDASKQGVKEEIAIAAFEYAVQVVNKEVRKRTKVIDNPIDKLKAVVYFYKERILNPPVEGGCPILNTSIEADDNMPGMRWYVLKALDYWKARIVFTIEKGQEAGLIIQAADPAQFALTFVGMIEGGIMMSRIYNSVEPFNVMAAQLIDMIEGIRA